MTRLDNVFFLALVALTTARIKWSVVCCLGLTTRYASFVVANTTTGIR